MTSVDLVDYIAYALSASPIPRVDWRKEAIAVADDVIKDAFAEGYAVGLETHSEHEYDAGYHTGYSARDKLSCASCGDGGKPVEE